MLALIAGLQTVYDYDLQADHFDPTHVYEARLLYTPLFCEYVGFITRPLDITHMGIGFFDMNDTSKHIIYQYNANQEPDYEFKLLQYLIPKMTWNETSGLYDIEFLGDVNVYVDYNFSTDKCMWEDQTIVAENIPGEVLNSWSHDYAQWFQDSFRRYSVLEMWYTDPYERFEDYHGNQCHDFAWWGMQDLQNKYGIKFNGKTADRLHAFFQLDREKSPDWDPVLLNTSDPVDNQKIYEFNKWYQRFCEGKTDEQIADDFFSGRVFEERQKLELSIITFVGNDFFEIKTDKFPVWFKKDSIVVPDTDYERV